MYHRQNDHTTFPWLERMAVPSHRAINNTKQMIWFHHRHTKRYEFILASSWWVFLSWVFLHLSFVGICVCVWCVIVTWDVFAMCVMCVVVNMYICSRFAFFVYYLLIVRCSSVNMLFVVLYCMLSCGGE